MARHIVSGPAIQAGMETYNWNNDPNEVLLKKLGLKI